MGTETTPTTSDTVETPTDTAKNSTEPKKVTTTLPQEVGSINDQIINTRPRVGGRLRQFYDRWCKITSDPFILSAILGYKIEFDENCMPLKRSSPYYRFKRNQKEFNEINTEISNLLDKNVIETCDYEMESFFQTSSHDRKRMVEFV